MIRLSRIQQVNQALAWLGESSRLRRGRGYFYFDGPALAWPTSSVMVTKADSLSVSEWLGEFDALRQADRRRRNDA